MPVHDLGTDAQGRLYYTMKLVQGVTLNDLIRQLRRRDEETIQRYPLNHLLTVFRKVCDAMAFAHSRGIIHRDLKPQNIMVGEFGEVLVMDWGLAKILSGATAEKESAPNSFAEESIATLPPGLNQDAPEGMEETVVTGTDKKADSPALAFTEQTEKLPAIDDIDLTMEGTVMGTPHYMAPEQAQGRITDMDARSDIFSLGGILYALLTLRPPVEGETVADILDKVRSGDIKPPSTITAPDSSNPNSPRPPASAFPHLPHGRMPSAISAVAMKALAADADDRYQTVTKLAADVEAYQDGFATSAEDAGLMTQLRLLIQRNRREFAIGFAAWTIITTLAVWFVINLRDSERRALKGESDARAAEQTATNATEVAIREKELARQALANTSLALADAALREGDGGAMQAALKNVPENLRGQTWRYLSNRADSSIARVQTGRREDDAVAPDPTRPGVFAVADRDGLVAVINVRTGERLLEFAPAFPKSTARHHPFLAWSPAGRRLAIGRSDRGGIVIHDARNGSHLSTLGDHASGELRFSPDGRRLLQNDVRADLLRMWDTELGEESWTYRPKVGHEVHGVFHPDGQHVVAFDLRSGIALLDVQTGELARLVISEEAATAALSVSPNGDACVIGKPEGAVFVIDLKSGQKRFGLHLPSTRPQRLAFTGDSRRLITHCVLPDGRHSIRVWSVETGEPLDTVLGGQGINGGIAVHPVSGELFVTGKPSRVWDLAGPPRRWTLGKSWNATLAYCGADDLLVAPAGNRMSGLVRLDGERAHALWRPQRGDYSVVSASKDGQLAAFIPPNKPAPIVLLRKLRSPTGPEVTQHPATHVDLGRLSPSGKRIAIVRKADIRVSDVETDQSPLALNKEDLRKIHALEWTGDEDHLIGLGIAFHDRGHPDSRERLLRWNSTTGKLEASIEHPSAMNALAIAPDMSHLAEAGIDRMVRVRERKSLAVVREFRVHDAPITALTWHPTKPILATASANLTIRLWNSETAELLLEIRALLRAPHTIAFSPSGRYLAAASREGVTRIWEPAVPGLSGE